jgi:hypothetical protein
MRGQIVWSGAIRGVEPPSQRVAAGHRDLGLRGLQIADLDAPALLALVWKATDTPALRELVRYCRAAFA